MKITPEAKKLIDRIRKIEDEVEELEQSREYLCEELHFIVLAAHPCELIELGADSDVCDESPIGFCA